MIEPKINTLATESEPTDAQATEPVQTAPPASTLAQPFVQQPAPPPTAAVPTAAAPKPLFDMSKAHRITADDVHERTLRAATKTAAQVKPLFDMTRAQKIDFSHIASHRAEPSHDEMQTRAQALERLRQEQANSPSYVEAFAKGFTDNLKQEFATPDDQNWLVYHLKHPLTPIVADTMTEQDKLDHPYLAEVVSTGSDLSSPLNLALMALPVGKVAEALGASEKTAIMLSKAATKGFANYQLVEAAIHSPSLIDDANSGDWDKFQQDAIRLGVHAGLGYMAHSAAEAPVTESLKAPKVETPYEKSFRTFRAARAAQVAKDYTPMEPTPTSETVRHFTREAPYRFLRRIGPVGYLVHMMTSRDDD